MAIKIAVFLLTKSNSCCSIIHAVEKYLTGWKDGHYYTAGVLVQLLQQRGEIGPVVQLVRMPACHAGGRGFEPLPGRQNRSRTSEVRNKKSLGAVLKPSLRRLDSNFRYAQIAQ
jgi:hypothetical protein